MKMKQFQRGVAETTIMALSFLIICLGLSIMGVRNYYLLSNYKSETFKAIPSDVDVYANINFYPVIWQLEHTKSGEETQEIKDLKELLGIFQSKSKINVEEDLLSWMEADLSFGIFKSENLYRYIKAARKLDKCKHDLYSTGNALEMYYEVNKSYPKELKELMPDYMEKLPLCPSEGKYEYKTEQQNQAFLLECCENAHVEAGLAGKNPSYRGEKGKGHMIDSHREMPADALPDVLLVTKVKNMADAEAFIAKIGGDGKISSVEYKGTKINSFEKELFFCFTDTFLIISNNEDTVKKSVNTLKEDQDNITKNKLFSKFMEKKPEYCLSSLFINLEHILSPVAKDITKEPLNKILPPAIKAFRSYSVAFSGSGRGMKMDTYLNIDKESDSPVIKILLDKNREQSSGLKIIPDDMSMIVTSSELKSGHEIGREFMKSFPDMEEKYKGLNQMVGLLTQLDIDKDIIDNISGDLTVATSITETYLEDLKKMATVEKVKRDLTVLGEATLTYQKENGGKIPGKLEDLKPAYIAEIPSAPYGGSYVILPLDEKQTGEYPPFYTGFSGILPGLEKDFPKYYSQNGITIGKDETGQEKIMPVPMMDMVFVMGIKNKEPFKKLLDLATPFIPAKLEEITYRRTAYSTFNNLNVAGTPFNLSCAFIGDYFVISTGKTVKPMEHVIDTFRGNKKSILKMKDYKTAIQEMGDGHVTGFSYMNMNDILKISAILPENEEIGKENMQKVSEQFRYIWGSSMVEDDGIHSVMFIPLN